MKAPDKVYIDDLAIVNDCVTKIALKPLPNFSEYIRKDAILDKLKTQRDKCVYRSTYWDFYQAIITEIKAL